MTPTWTSGDVTLYLGDCLEVLPTLAAGSVDAVVTDPPYVVGGKVEIRGHGVARRQSQSTTIGNQGWTYTKEWLAEAGRICKGQILSFAGYKDLAELLIDWGQGTLKGIFTWCKPNAALPAWNVPHYDTEFAAWWSTNGNPTNIRRISSMVLNYPFPQAGCFATERVLLPGTKRAAHPSQKPLALMVELLLALTDDSATTLDPFMGSGTTGVACVQTGRKFIGIEIDPGYFEIARKRIEQAQAQGRLGGI